VIRARQLCFARGIKPCEKHRGIAYTTYNLASKFSILFKPVCVVALLLGAPSLVSAQLAIYEFRKGDGNAPDSNSPNPSVTTPATGATFDDFQRINLVAETGGPQVWDSSHWAVGAFDSTKYTGFQVHANTGYYVTLSSLQWDSKRENGTGGPTDAMVKMYLNGVEQTSYDFSPTELNGKHSSWDFTDITFTGTNVVEFRFYGWNGTRDGGHLSLDQVETGGYTVVPEFTTLGIAGMGIVMGGAFSGLAFLRRRLKSPVSQ
jgi:hypothetical protein